MKRLLTFAALIFVCSSCSLFGNGHYDISGLVKGAEGKLIFLEELGEDGRFAIIDSVSIDKKGRFQLEAGEFVRPDFYQLRISGMNTGIPIIPSEDAIILETSLDDFLTKPNFKTFCLSATAKEIADSCSKFAMKFKDVDSDSTSQSNYSTQKSVLKAYLIQAIDKHPSDLLGVFAFYQANDLKLFEAEADFPKLENFSNTLLKEAPEIRYGKLIQAAILPYKTTYLGLKAQNKVKVGDRLTDFTLKTPSDSEVSINSIHSKVVLIQCWASWDKASKESFPMWRDLYKAKHSYGFEVISVSFDTDKAAWSKMIAEYNLPGIHVSDLKKWESIAAKMYGITSLPFNILLDSNQVVVGKNLSGRTLTHTVDSLLNR